MLDSAAISGTLTKKTAVYTCTFLARWSVSCGSVCLGTALERDNDGTGGACRSDHDTRLLLRFYLRPLSTDPGPQVYGGNGLASGA